jgi:GAF domain-containing protein
MHNPQINKLKQLVELSLTLSGDPIEIFRHAAKMIGELLEVKVVCLSEIQGGQLNFLAVYIDGEIYSNAGVCSLAITPCATVEQSKDIKVYDRVAELFPEATFLKDHNAFAYCGFPSLDNQGKVVAVTCLLDDKPHDFTIED